jgi:toxin ParE1/3/4
VKVYPVRFRPLAEADLTELYDYIAERAGVTAAGPFIDRIEKACLALAHFPNRGSKRDDLRPELRILGFERRAAIAFVVTDSEVVIARIFYGGRDIELHALGLEGA